jgi:predicted secreted protein
MAHHRGEDGSVKFEAASGTLATIANTRSWSLSMEKETLDTTAHGDSSRTFVGGLIAGSGSAELIYDDAGTGETDNFITDVLRADDPADASFELYLDGTKKISFAGIITGAEFGASTGDLETVTVSFITSGAITAAV